MIKPPKGYDELSEKDELKGDEFSRPDCTLSVVFAILLEIFFSCGYRNSEKKRQRLF